MLKEPDAERRRNARLLCSDLVRLVWVDGPLQGRKEFAVLENVSLSGASVLAGVPAAEGVRMRIVAPHTGFVGTVRHCHHAGNGYLLGIAFDPGCKWSQTTYVPEHLLDPRELREDPEV